MKIQYIWTGVILINTFQLVPDDLRPAHVPFCDGISLQRVISYSPRK